MGFSLEEFFEELDEILSKTDQKAAKTVKEISVAVAFWKKYAQECGQLPRDPGATG